MVHFRWRALGWTAKVSSILAVSLGGWGMLLFAEVPISGTLGGCEYGLCFLWLLILPISLFLIVAGMRLLLLPLSPEAIRPAVLSILLGSILPVLMTTAYYVHMRYLCWPNQPIEFCA